ncbi:MAG: 16S rRNA (guanine(527)-N(7))-methyltransferase RsmG [Alphaproteobacteria bacterium]|jgi:16S rRNA (guanine527-N7)-methyltransferase|nr:16S rRNA (guanine(527)-N(7))-methyltransferase RsmG [Alphaproteobacteria bacterium]
MSAADFAAETGVSRETLARFEAYLALLRHWQERINLVAASTLADPWRRHMLDSAQLLPLLPKTTRRIADLGAGAGFPGLPLAILAPEPVEVLLLESDSRKAAFLAAAIRETDAPAQVICARIETVPVHDVDVAVARACAPLAKLLGLARPLLAPGGRALFLKGRRAEEELTAASEAWTMTLARHTSRTDPDSTIFEASDITPCP